MKALLNTLRRRNTETVIDDHISEISRDSDAVSINPFTGRPVEIQDDENHRDMAPNDHYTPVFPSPEAATKRLKLPDFSAFSPRFSISPSYALIAFQAGSFGLRGALITNTRHYATPAIAAESRNVDFTRAIADVLEQLKRHQKRLPQTAILITPSVVSSLVNLPVSPLRPRSDEQMQDLIRWELEGAITQQNKQWLIGSMLVERGYLSPQQRDELVDALQLRQTQGGETAIIRFGDLAVQMKYITRDQLEECFALQGKLVALDDDLVYGWQAEESRADQTLSDEALLSTEEDNNSAHKWLVSGMSKEVRRRWVGAFNLNNLKIEAFYPSIGASFASLSRHSHEPEQWLIEIHPEQLACISGHSGGVTDIQVCERLSGRLNAQHILSLCGVLPADLQRIYVNHQNQLNTAQLSQLSADLDIKLQSLTLDVPELIKPENLSDEALLCLAGAADHYLQHVPRYRLSRIAARDAEPPLWHRLLRPKVLTVSAVFCLLLAMSSFMGWMYLSMSQAENRLEALNVRFDKESKLKHQFGNILNEQTELKNTIDHTLRMQSKNESLLEKLTRQQPRQLLAATVLLKAISISIPEGVRLQRIERHQKQVAITAYARDDSEGQAFIHTLNLTLKPMLYQVLRSEVIQTTERRGETTLPYTISVTLIENSLVLPQATALSTQKTGGK